MARPDMAASIQDAVHQLPPEKQEVLKDFAEFLLHQTRLEADRNTARERFITRFLDTPLQLSDFVPLTRDEAHDR